MSKSTHRSAERRKKNALRVPSDSVPRKAGKEEPANNNDTQISHPPPVETKAETPPAPDNSTMDDSGDVTVQQEPPEAPTQEPKFVRSGTVALGDDELEECTDIGEPPQAMTIEAELPPASASGSASAPVAASVAEAAVQAASPAAVEAEVISADSIAVTEPTAKALPEDGAVAKEVPSEDAMTAPKQAAPVEPVAAPAEAPPASPPPAAAAAAQVAPPPPPKKGPPPAPAKAVMIPRSRSWFDDVFDEDYLRTLPLLTPLATQSEAKFAMESLAIEAGAQVLDAGCGYGRHAMELAARGYHVVGLDNSLPLLLRGAEEAQRRGLSIHFVHGDMRDIEFDSQFDAVYCLFNTFGYFDDDTNKRTAQNFARALKPGGRLLLDVLNRDYIIADLPSRVWWEGDGCVVLEEVDFNYFTSRVVSNRSLVFDDGRQVEQEISIRVFSLHELGKLLHSVGLRVIEVSGNMATRGRFFGAQSRDLIIVAEKR
jgi:SAM-dependent methyltransferase